MQVHVWRPDSGQVVALYREHRGVVYAVVWTKARLVARSPSVSVALAPSSVVTAPPLRSTPKMPVSASGVSGSVGTQPTALPYAPPKYVPPSLVTSQHLLPVPPAGPRPSEKIEASPMKPPTKERVWPLPKHQSSTPMKVPSVSSGQPSVPWQRPLSNNRPRGLTSSQAGIPSSPSPQNQILLPPSISTSPPVHPPRVLPPGARGVPPMPFPSQWTHSYPLAPRPRFPGIAIAVILLLVSSPFILIVFSYLLIFVGVLLRVLFHL